MAPRQTPDHVLRESLRTRENLRDFLESALPQEAAHFDFTQVEELARDFFAGDWREREADLIFQIGYRVAERTVPALVGVIVEHQTNTDSFVPLRALFLLASYWERHWRLWDQSPSPRAAFTLPPVFCVVLYTADRPWGSNENVRQLLGEPQAFHRFAPDWGPVFWNLSERSPDALLAGPPWMQLMAVVGATGVDAAEFERVFTEVNRHLSPVAAASHSRWSQLFRMVMGYSYFRRPAAEHQRIREIAERENAERVEEVRDVEKTIAQAMEDRGELRGIQTGALREARRALLALMRSRLGSQCPEQLLQQIEASTSVEELQAAFDRALARDDLTGFQLRE